MLLAGLIAIATLMVHTRATNKLKMAKKLQQPGEYISLSESEEDSTDWDALMQDDLTPIESNVRHPAQAKVPKAPTAADKGKTTMFHMSFKRKAIAKRSKRIREVEIPEHVIVDDEHAPVSEDRVKAFSYRECIGERHVNLKALRVHCSEFGMIIDQGNLSPICQFPESTGFCLHLVRNFYSNAQHLREQEGGPMQFITSVQNKKLIITPHLIGEVIGMPSSLSGTQYLKGCASNNVEWQRVVDGICMPETRPKGHSIQSKELLQEYRFLNYIVCYNVLPNMQTKVLRWERMAFLYLLGHPSEAHGLNVNIPYLIWSRMTKYIDSTRSSERLPFPMIIMRILRKLNVDTSSSSYFYSQGTINDSTIVKSSFTRPNEPPPSQHTSEDDALLTSIHKEQQKLALEQARLSRKQEQICDEIELITASQIVITKKTNSIHKIMKKLAAKMNCPLSNESDSD